MKNDKQPYGQEKELGRPTQGYRKLNILCFPKAFQDWLTYHQSCFNQNQRALMK